VCARARASECASVYMCVHACMCACASLGAVSRKCTRESLYKAMCECDALCCASKHALVNVQFGSQRLSSTMCLQAPPCTFDAPLLVRLGYPVGFGH